MGIRGFMLHQDTSSGRPPQAGGLQEMPGASPYVLIYYFAIMLKAGLAEGIS